MLETVDGVSQPESDKDAVVVQDGSPATRHRQTYSQDDGLDQDVDSSLIEGKPASNQKENPKRVLKSGLSFKDNLVHIFALFTTGIVLVVNFRHVYCWDQDDPDIFLVFISLSNNTVNNLLQFASKVHELIIVASLTSIVTQHVLKRLVSGKGLPFGLLGSGYQASSVEFLWKKALWAGFLVDPLLRLIIAGSIIFATTVGPSSAVAIIPRLQWWSIPRPFAEQVDLFMDSTEAELYPSKLRAPNMTLMEGCDTSNYSALCPGAGFESLRDWVTSWYNQGVMPQLLITESRSQARRSVGIETEKSSELFQLLFTESNNQLSDRSFASTLINPLVELTALFWDYAQGQQTWDINIVDRPLFVTSDLPTVKLAVIEALCTSYNYTLAMQKSELNEPYVTFPRPGYDDENSTSWLVSPSLWNFTRPMNTTNFTWVDMANLGASIGALFTLPLLRWENESAKTGLRQESLLIPCTVTAVWAPADVEFDPTISNQVKGSFTDPDSYFDAEEAITISPEWASLLNVPGVTGNLATGEVVNGSMMEALVSTFIERVNTSDFPPTPYLPNNTTTSNLLVGSAHKALTPMLAAVIAEGLSRQSYYWTRPVAVLHQGPNDLDFVELDNPQSANSLDRSFQNASAMELQDLLDNEATRVDYSVFQYGYGYGIFDDRTGNFIGTVLFGIIVMLIHFTVVLLYLFYILARRCFVKGSYFMSKAWSSLDEMLALALISRPPNVSKDVLRNVSAGIEKSYTWLAAVHIRERDVDSLELIIEPLLVNGAQKEDSENAEQQAEPTLRPQINKRYK